MISFFALSGLLNFIVSIFLAVLVYLKGKRIFANKIFALNAFSVAFWSFGYFFWQISTEESSALFWSRFLMVGSIFIPIFYFHFIVSFLNLVEKHKKILYGGYSLSTLFLILNFTPYFVKSVEPELFFPFWPKPGIFFHPFLLMFFNFVVYGWYLLLKSLRETKEIIKQQQIKYFLLGTGIGFICGSTNYFLWYGIPIPPYLNILVSIYVVLTAFSITKYHLFEIRVILTEMLVGAMGIILVILPFVMPTGSLQILTATIFILFCVFAYCLIKATHEEARQREKAEIMAVREKAFREKAEKLNRLKTEFLAMASHQLRTPPTSIKGYISLILEGDYGKISTEARDVLKKIFGANERLIRIVNQFLTAANLDLGRLRPEIKEIFLEKEILESLTEEFRPKIEAKNLYLKFKKPEVLTRVFIDPDQLKEVFSNLLDNATKYTLKGGIEVSVKKQEKSVLVAIKDTGEGLTQKEKLIIFESFGKGKAGYLHWMEGAGLGLYITKKLIELNKGKIWAESEGKNKGSTFYIELPLKESLRLPTGQAIK